VIFIIQVLKLAFKSINLKEYYSYYAGLTLLMASMWLFLHGFGENFGLIGATSNGYTIITNRL
jgi:hypothetical protein